MAKVARSVARKNAAFTSTVQLSSIDAGLMLLGQVDRKLGWMDTEARCIADPRSPLLFKHSVRDMWRQRVDGAPNWCERAYVHGIVGLARNARLQAQVEFAELRMKDECERTGTQQRLADAMTQKWPATQASEEGGATAWLM